MHSQRRHITDVEIYGKNAERFLSLRPSFTNNTDKYEEKFNLNSIEKPRKFSSVDPSQSKHVTFDQNAEPNERYECTFAAYLEVRKSVFLSYLIIFCVCLGCTF